MQFSAPGRLTERRIQHLLVPMLVPVGLAGGGWLFYVVTAWISGSPAEPQHVMISSIVISIMMAAVPVMVCLVQTTSKRRQLEKIESISGEPVYRTAYCRVARIALGAISPPTLGGDYVAPMVTFAVVASFSCLLAMAGMSNEAVFDEKSAILGGMKLLELDGLKLRQYQEGTFIVASMAFVGAYVYMLARLLDRTGNNDLYPISLHYYSARILIACLTATVYRHVAATFAGESTAMLVLVGFVTGLAPDLLIAQMARKAFKMLDAFGAKADPADATRPTALPLQMLDDVTKDKADRLAELGIDSAQVLACQNPFILWPKLPYDLGLIVDWIAAAQLYTLVKEVGLQKLRARAVTDIFDLHQRLSNADSAPAVCAAIGIEEKEAPSVIDQLATDQSFCRLLEVQQALLARSAGSP
jgi:hypothetical protein